MNARERFQRIMHFKKPDRVPLWDLEGVVRQTIAQWYREGLPTDVGTYVSLHDYLGFDRDEHMPISTLPIPIFLERVVEEDDERITVINKYGFKEIRLKKQRTAGLRSYSHLEGPVKTRSDWEVYKKRYNPHDIRRYSKFWGRELLERYNNNDHPVSLYCLNGPAEAIAMGYGIGWKRFLEALYYDPKWIHDIFGFWADFLIELLREVVQEAKIDYVFIDEDGLGTGNRSLISPQTYRKFWLPHWKKVTSFFRKNGIDIVGFYSSGNYESLIPVLLETGFNLFGPLECASRMDAIKLRKEYGRDVLLMGNINRQALVDGKEAIEKEVNSKVPWLMEQGGYIPAVDDEVLPDVSLETYLHYTNLIKQLGK